MDISPIVISLKTAAVATVITFFLGIVLAAVVAFMKSEKIKMILDAFLTLPLVLPPTVVGFLLLMIFGANGTIGKFILETFGQTIVFTWWATVLAAIVISLPLMYRAARGAFEQIDRNLIDAGKTLGMSDLKIFLGVVMPLARPGVAAGGILAFARGLGEFGATIILAGNIAGKTKTIPIAIYSHVVGGDIPGAYNYVAILCIITFVVVIALNIFSLKGNVNGI